MKSESNLRLNLTWLTSVTYGCSRINTLLIILLYLAITSCGSQDSDEPEIMDDPLTSSFRLSGSGYAETIQYNSDDNLIFARLTGADMWIRMAMSKTGNGESSPHIDIDICNFSGSGTYAPTDPTIRPCGDGPLWDIFWHDASRVFSNQATSSPCDLVLVQSGDVLEGRFSCNDLLLIGGTDLLNILNGTFKCRIEEG